MQMQATLPVEQRRTTIQVVKEMGIKGLYTGTSATLIRDVPFSVLLFPAYANLKSFLAIKEGPKKGKNCISF
jgi:solute carrier family 25 aspartate/glutamate transporter 12/13